MVRPQNCDIALCFLGVLITVNLSLSYGFSASLNKLRNGQTLLKPLNSRTVGLRMHFEESLLETKLQTGQFTAQRYVASNRFKVKPKSMAKFEKRWADRQSRLAQLDGFKFFTLLRRIDCPSSSINALAGAAGGRERVGSGFDSSKATLGNYISLTVWENKDNFDAWRTGEAFKEAHGGGGIADFVKLLTTAIFILEGPPKPAFFDALQVARGQDESLISPFLSGKEGWRKVQADGVNFIKPDLFVVQEYFSVAPGMEVQFEQSQMTSSSRDDDRGGDGGIEGGAKARAGEIGSTLLRRDAQKADDGMNYVRMRIFDCPRSYEAAAAASASAEAEPVGSLGGEAMRRKYLRETAFYEGKLALTKDGI